MATPNTTSSLRLPAGSEYVFMTLQAIQGLNVPTTQRAELKAKKSRAVWMGAEVMKVYTTEYILKYMPNATPEERQQLLSMYLADSALICALNSLNLGLAGAIVLGRGETRIGNAENVQLSVFKAWVGAFWLHHTSNTIMVPMPDAEARALRAIMSALIEEIAKATEPEKPAEKRAAGETSSGPPSKTSKAAEA